MEKRKIKINGIIKTKNLNNWYIEKKYCLRIWYIENVENHIIGFFISR